MNDDQARTVARLIVTDIMDNSCGKADRLVLTIDSVDGEPVKGIGGWGRKPLEHRITKKLIELRVDL